MQSSTKRASYRRHWQLAAAAVLISCSGIARADEGSLFTGTTRLACEAILCLSSSAGGATSACSPALSHYFGIRGKKFSDTLSLRVDFLRQCPVAHQTPQMASLVNAITHGAGRCDAASLNATLKTWSFGSLLDREVRISDQMPSYCRAYSGHAYTDLDAQTPRYVGRVHDGGYWVHPSQYEAELAKYNRIREERKRRARERDQHQFNN